LVSEREFRRGISDAAKYCQRVKGRSCARTEQQSSTDGGNTMPNQNIDASLTADDVAAITASFAAVVAKLPFAVNLTDQERKTLVKTGPDSVSFVQNALAAAQGNPSVLPGSFS